MVIGKQKFNLDLFSGRFLEARVPLLIATAALVCISLVTIYAIGNPAEETDSSADISILDTAGPSEVSDTPALQLPIANKYVNSWRRQVVYVLGGAVCLILVNLFDYRRLGPYSYAIYAVILGLLVLLLVDKIYDMSFIPFINGSRRWIRISLLGRDLLQIQPSEFCKVSFIIALAWYLRFRDNFRTFTGLIGPFGITLLAMVLIILEPDLGTMMLLMPILFTMLFVAGARVKHLLLIIFLAMLATPLLWHFMHSYQRLRISTVLLQSERIFTAAKDHPKLAQILVGDEDKLRTWKLDEGYHLLHSKQAIASGGVWGYGRGKGPYIRYDYLPERHNDFIFASIAHQFGLVGCVGVLLLYCIIIAAAMEIAWLNTDAFGRLVAAGIAAMFAVEVLVNVNMTLGLMPITGLTLPLVSYGGSSMIIHMIAIGLLNNIGRSRPFSVAKRPFEFNS